MKVLLSIKPTYAERIFDGEKRYEFSVNGHLRILIFGHENSPCELK